MLIVVIENCRVYFKIRPSALLLILEDSVWSGALLKDKIMMRFEFSISSLFFI